MNDNFFFNLNVSIGISAENWETGVAGVCIYMAFIIYFLHEKTGPKGSVDIIYKTCFWRN